MTAAVFNFATSLVQFPPSIISGLLGRKMELIVISGGMNSSIVKMP